VVGGLLGSAVGPIAGALSDKNILSAIGTAWNTAGSMGHLGLVLGGATALAGAFVISSKVGNLLTGDHGSNKAINWKNPATVIAGTTLVTAGLAAGAVGGIILGGGGAAAGTLISGLVHSGFHAAALTGLGTHALIGGTAGAIVAGGVGLAGGTSLTSGLARHVIDPVTAKIKNGSIDLSSVKAKATALLADSDKPPTRELTKDFSDRSKDWTMANQSTVLAWKRQEVGPQGPAADTIANYKRAQDLKNTIDNQITQVRAFEKQSVNLGHLPGQVILSGVGGFQDARLVVDPSGQVKEFRATDAQSKHILYLENNGQETAYGEHFAEGFVTRNNGDHEWKEYLPSSVDFEVVKSSSADQTSIYNRVSEPDLHRGKGMCDMRFRGHHAEQFRGA
jgi:hypothetical protein